MLIYNQNTVEQIPLNKYSNSTNIKNHKSAYNILHRDSLKKCDRKKTSEYLFLICESCIGTLVYHSILIFLIFFAYIPFLYFKYVFSALRHFLFFPVVRFTYIVPSWLYRLFAVELGLNLRKHYDVLLRCDQRRDFL